MKSSFDDSSSAPVFHSPTLFLESIPAELCSLPQWVCWRYEERNGKRTKPPIDPKSNGKLMYAKSNDPRTWSDFATATAAAQRLKLEGVGLALSASDGLTGLDLDHVFDPATGEVDPLATEVLMRFAGTYAEISPSGTGLRIWCYGKPKRSGKCAGKRKWLEVYAHPSSRYLTVTGNTASPGNGVAVTEQQAALDWLHQRFMQENNTEEEATPAPTPLPPVSILDDAQLLNKAHNARNGAVFGALWAGDTSGQGGDHSAADMALCGLLAFWTRNDPARMDRLFRQSGLMRPKWDVVHSAEGLTYGQASIAKAIADCREGYSGNRARSTKTAQGLAAPSGLAATGQEPDDADTQEIARLAALNPLDYDRQRGAAAKALGIRADTLDKLVKEARGETAEESSGGKALSFREVAPWPEPVAVDALLDELQSSVQRFLSLPEHAAPAIALWVIYSYCVVLHGHIAPTLAITSPEKRCGKSTLLGWLHRVVEKPLLAANITAAAIFRTIDAYAPTLLIDEADSFLGESGDELRGILNSGHTRDTAFVIRVHGDDLEPRQFSTWGAKAVALIGKLDGRYSTLADRSIEIQLRRRLPTDTVEKLRHAEPGHFERLAAHCVRFAQDHGAAIGKARPDIPDSLHDRAADNWEPLLAIADLAGGRWSRRARSTAMALSGGADDDSGQGIGVQLLADLRRYFEERPAASHATVDLLNYLISIEEAPWSSYARGKPLTARHLSRLLKPYGIVPQNIRIGNTVPKGYTVSDFKDAFARYLPSIRYNATSKAAPSESPDSVSATQTDCSGYESGSSASPQAGCSGIADKTTPTGREPGMDDDVADDDDWEEF